ncbi:glycine zipper domain-containing protein [Prosthecobacter sp. SYSU 5D2]|uniref:glycine zipper domain-containing protein n=1 Tax=Prosthecobacter sp. SYSU 5D2 TaxID=3134134 RepID=UPI0031FE5F3B
MKAKIHHLMALATVGLALTLSSCVSPYAGPHERDGAVIGAVGGGALGAIIGNQSGRPLEGAAIGGALGALAGSSIGASQDRRYYHRGGYGYSRPVYYRGGPRYSPYRGSYYRSGYSYGHRGYHPGYW